MAIQKSKCPRCDVRVEYVKVGSRVRTVEPRKVSYVSDAMKLASGYALHRCTAPRQKELPGTRKRKAKGGVPVAVPASEADAGDEAAAR
jgi:hypothetical protein